MIEHAIIEVAHAAVRQAEYIGSPIDELTVRIWRAPDFVRITVVDESLPSDGKPTRLAHIVARIEDGDDLDNLHARVEAAMHAQRDLQHATGVAA